MVVGVCVFMHESSNQITNLLVTSAYTYAQSVTHAHSHTWCMCKKIGGQIYITLYPYDFNTLSYNCPLWIGNLALTAARLNSIKHMRRADELTYHCKTSGNTETGRRVAATALFTLLSSDLH